jgi:hypothetical protein
MASPNELATAHQVARNRVTSAATVRALRLWRQMNPTDLDRSWDALAPALVTQVTLAQVAAANQSAGYMRGVSAHYGGAPAGAIVPEAFGGVMLDGREVGPAMFGAVTTTKDLVGKGYTVPRAFEVGASFLATIVGAAVSDMGRQADNTAATARHFTRYVRVLSPGACSRCAILAGVGDYSKPYKRHPRCKCTSWPLLVDGEDNPMPEGMYETPGQYFESMTEAEQNRVFTNAGAYAIREGADPISVVNARRGYFGAAPVNGPPRRLRPVTIGRKADGSPLTVFATDEGTTARGAFAKAEGRAKLSAAKQGRYRRTTSIRLMPEQIQIMAGDNPERARELLTRYGYMR